MSDIGGAGNGAFDLPFLVLEVLALLGSLVLAVAARRSAVPNPTLAGVQVIVGFVAGVGLPLLWNTVWPIHDGIEGAGRFILGGAASGLNALACAAGCGFSPKLSVPAKLVNGVLQLAATSTYWVAFLNT